MYSFLAIAASGDVAVHDRRPQVVAALLLDQPRADTSPSCRVTPGFLQVALDVGVDAVGLAGHGERRQGRLRDLPAAAAATGPMLARRCASAIFSVCRDAQTPEQLMQPRPLLTKTLSTMMSRYFSH